MSGDDRIEGCRILVVDDERMIRESVEEFFTPHGYEVVLAANGAEALEKIDELPPDVIICDVVMPVMDGWELFDEVRQRPETSNVPFLFLSVENELAWKLRGLHLGADDYITKPFEIEELHARVERSIRRRRSEAEEEVLLAGSLEHLAISDLLQILALNGKDGVVVLSLDGEEGRIFFESGAIVHAACGKVAGSKALYRMLGWENARFRLVPRSGEIEEKTIHSPSGNLLMDGLVSLDEWKRWKTQLPPLTTNVAPAPAVSERLKERSPTRAECEVMLRVDTGASILEILEEIPIPDADLAEALCGLISRGVLEAPGSEVDTHT